MPLDVEAAISLVLDVLEKKGTLFIYREEKKRGTKARSLWFSAGPYPPRSAYGIIIGADIGPNRPFDGPSAAADCARAVVNLCGSAMAVAAVDEWKEKKSCE